MDHIEITRVTAEAAAALREISVQTFTETFAASNTADNMRNYLEKEFSLDKLQSELNDRGSEFYFATDNDRVVGYLKLNSGLAQTELKNEEGLEIERIYVSKAWQGNQVGQLLYQKALERARQKNAGYLWLGVWEENHRAIGFYKKNGFVAFDSHIFRLGEDEQRDIMMKLDLQ